MKATMLASFIMAIVLSLSLSMFKKKEFMTIVLIGWLGISFRPDLGCCNPCSAIFTHGKKYGKRVEFRKHCKHSAFRTNEVSGMDLVGELGNQYNKQDNDGFQSNQPSKVRCNIYHDHGKR